jgi:glycosyltransferase involved in cell wall biosynthesis
VRVVLISGIFPPDIGGPATHVSDLRRELVRRGHRVAVLTLHDGAGVVHADGVTRYPRSWPWPVRFVALVRWLVARRTAFDVIYASGLQTEAVLGARVAGRPVVTKVVGDAAWERGHRRGLIDRRFETFQREGSNDMVVRAMQAVQRAWIRRSSAVVTPSSHLRHLVEDWIGRPAGITVIPNGVVAAAASGKARGPVGMAGLSLLVVGRLVPHKRIDRVVEALACIDLATLTVVGDGPARMELESLAASHGISDRVAFRGAIPHQAVLELMRSSDALVLASDYEGLPHVAIEALTSGLPIVAPNVGGAVEVLRDRRNGLIVDPPTPRGLAEAFERLRAEPNLMSRLASGAIESAKEWSFDRTADAVESLIDSLAAPRPRMVFLGKSLAPSPPTPSIERKLQILTECVEPVLVNVGRAGHRWYGRVPAIVFPQLRPPLLGGAFFYSTAPFVAMALAARRRPSVMMCQSPFEAVVPIAIAGALPRSVRPKIVVEVHGDWRSAPRMYGSSARSSISAFSDALARFAIRNADRVRVIGAFTERLVREIRPDVEVERFIAFTDLGEFLDVATVPPPDDERVLFVGALELYKGVDVLLRAWADVRVEHPDALLTIVGNGSLAGTVARAAEDVGSGVDVAGRVPHGRILELLDRSRFLVLPSRSEGMGRVILEASARERAVVAARSGGIPELIEEGQNGVLVPPGDASSLAAAIRAGLEDPEKMGKMGRNARQLALDIDPDADFEKGIRRLAEWAATSWHR